MSPCRGDRASDRVAIGPEARSVGAGDAASESEAEFIRLLTGAQCSLRGYILALLGGPKKDADDVLQDANVAIWEKRAEYDRARPFTPWAVAFAFQRVRAFRRDSARSRLVFSDSLVEEMHGYFQQSLMHDPTTQDHLRGCLEKLTPAEQNLVDKRYSRNTSIESLSSTINKSAGSIANRLFRIREKLRLCIQSRIAQAGHEG